MTGPEINFPYKSDVNTQIEVTLLSKMASIIFRNARLVIQRTAQITSVRYSGHTPSVIDPQEGKVATDKVSMADTLGQSVGAERYEQLMRLAGNEDPFEMNVMQMGKGTKSEPTAIPSLYEKRLVGCICEEDAVSINWMHLHKGEPKRCECGYWFKLEAKKPEKLAVELKQAHH
ncbi:unnamed protein product [Owenia fusiformis]|uniref:Cytochrome c oxidase subunit 5B, mitochondrial n=1 Tax=Owenia fusiformis TaxID=6347 RepID=A0A8S4N2R7_OWEFU|nr:unnamed protein product [Owenia fusiformis]